MHDVILAFGRLRQEDPKFETAWVALQDPISRN
jgi:hypothetical protein